MPFIAIGKTCDVKNGTGKPIEIRGTMIALFNVNGMFYAIDNTCPHRRGPLGEGSLDGTVVECPLHGWTFDIATGAATRLPGVKVRTFPVAIEGDDVLVDVP